MSLEKSYIYNIHHLLPRSRGGSENKDNKVHFQINQHAKFHGFFNHGTFCEQILQLIKLSDKALDKKIIQELQQLLEREQKDFYKDIILKKGNILPRTIDSSHFFKENSKTMHYILPLSRGGSENEDNKEKLSVNTYRNFFEVFGTTIFPEQILQLLSLSSSALEPRIIKEFLYVMKYHKLAEFYKEEVIQYPWKILPSITKNLTQLNFHHNRSIHAQLWIQENIFNTLKIMSKK